MTATDRTDPFISRSQHLETAEYVYIASISLNSPIVARLINYRARNDLNTVEIRTESTAAVCGNSHFSTDAPHDVGDTFTAGHAVRDASTNAEDKVVKFGGILFSPLSSKKVTDKVIVHVLSQPLQRLSCHFVNGRRFDGDPHVRAGRHIQ